jgi:hypothetical protein
MTQQLAHQVGLHNDARKGFCRRRDGSVPAIAGGFGRYSNQHDAIAKDPLSGRRGHLAGEQVSQGNRFGDRCRSPIIQQYLAPLGINPLIGPTTGLQAK